MIYRIVLNFNKVNVKNAYKEHTKKIQERSEHGTQEAKQKTIKN